MLFYFEKKGDKEPLGLLLLEGKLFYNFALPHLRHSLSHLLINLAQDVQSNCQLKKNPNSIALN